MPEKPFVSGKCNFNITFKLLKLLKFCLLKLLKFCSSLSLSNRVPKVASKAFDVVLFRAELDVWLVVFDGRELAPEKRDRSPSEDEGGNAVRMLQDLLGLDKVGAVAGVVAAADEIPSA
jgi:hypothetical protein